LLDTDAVILKTLSMDESRNANTASQKSHSGYDDSFVTVRIPSGKPTTQSELTESSLRSSREMPEQYVTAASSHI